MYSFLNMLLVIKYTYVIKIGLLLEFFISNHQLSFKINSISLIESEEFRETSNGIFAKLKPCLVQILLFFPWIIFHNYTGSFLLFA